MRVEVTQDLQLDQRQQTQLDLHSFLNVLNVLSGDLLLFHDTAGSEPFAATLEACYQVSDTFQNDPSIAGVLAQFEKLRQLFGLDCQANQALASSPQEAVKEQWDNLQSVVAVLDIRYAEMKARLQASDGWLTFQLPALRREIEAFLGVVEKNSLGRYHIVTNVACKEPRDYLVHLEFACLNREELVMPGVLKDVLRDLLANARKYTEPGGTIEVGLAETQTCIRLVVKDNGRGIPEDQLQQVVEFGFRGRNVAAHETKGAGFGLTKAYWVARHYRGKMWIESAELAGTTVTLEIPRFTES